MREAFGVDAVQALQLCLQMISIHLAEHRRTGQITWLGGADLGFPPIPSYADPPEDEVSGG